MSELNKDWLKEKIQSFGKNEIVFCNEAQFQFKLAWEIQKEFQKYNVLLEDLSMREIETKNEKKYYKKNYTDIVVKTDNNEYIAIELKYKTKELDVVIDENKITLSNQGATDLGRFDYIWDINRLEFLTNAKNESKIKKENELRTEANNYRENELLQRKYEINKKFKNHTSAFAIILTNDESYWSFSKRKNVKQDNSIKLKSCKENSQYREFCIAQGDTIDNKCDWKKDKDGKYKKAVLNTWRGRPIELLNKYTFSWVKYNKCFNFCITEVTEQVIK